MMGSVVEKIKTDGARGILIAPDWQTREWWGPIKNLVQKSIYFPIGTRLFDTEKGPAGPIRWGAWAMLVDGKKANQAEISQINLANEPSGRGQGSESETETVFLRTLARTRPIKGDVYLKVRAIIDLGYDQYPCRALIDTGAEVNLIRRGLCDAKYNRPAEKKLCLMAANNQRLGGGENEVEMELHFEGVDSNTN